MIPRRDLVHLHDILEAARAVEKALLGEDEAAFLRDERLQGAVAQRLFAVGVSASRLSRAVRLEARDIAWRELADAGESLVRPGAALDWRLVWCMARRDLPQIVLTVSALVRGDSSAA